MRTLVISIFFTTAINSILIAQDTLPKITVTNISNNVLISWTNPYGSLTTINIQRSFDSAKNFRTIGTILDVKNKRNGYVDAKPLSLKMFYRLFLSFEGGTYIFTKSYLPVKDTSKAQTDLKKLQQSSVLPWFVPSPRVYTGPDNNVKISLPDADKKKYSLQFFEENGTPVLQINKVPEPFVTLEKVNFSHSGTFNFELFEDGKLIEKYKIYIPKDKK